MKMAAIKCLSALLAVLLLLSVLPMTSIAGLASVAEAASQYTVNGVSLPLPGFEAGKNVYKQYNCWKFAQMVYGKLWNGQSITASQSTNDNLLKNVSFSNAERKATAANLKKYVTQCAPGSILRISRTMNDVKNSADKDAGHSVVIVARTDKNLTIYDSTSSGIGLKTLTYDSFSNYTLTGNLKFKDAYIKYIKAPGLGFAISSVVSDIAAALKIAKIRTDLVNMFHDMATVKWICSENFTVKVGSGKQTYYKGKTYYGLPYAQKSGSSALTLEMFKNAMKDGKIGKFIGQSDCSTSMGVVYKKCTDLKMLWCPSEFKSSSNGFVKVGSVGDYSKLQPGDVLVSSGHIMMVVSVDAAKKKVKVIHQSSAYFVYDPVKDTTGDPKSNMQNRNCSWGVNQDKSFSVLKSGGYQGYCYKKLSTETALTPVANPTISSNNTANGQNVSITCATAGATIYYTTDGSDPTTSKTRTKYSKAILLTATKTVRAYAEKSGMATSATVKKEISVPKVEKPTISANADQFGYNISVATKTADATIYYTTDGSMPSTASKKYEGHFTVSTQTTVKAIAVKTGMATSDVATTSLNPVAPASPSIRLTSGADLAVGEAVQIEWTDVNNTSEYTVLLVSDRGVEITTSVKSSIAAVELHEPGTYSITVTAENAFGQSPVSNTVAATVHEDVTVIFSDYDGTTLSSQRVKWGGSASAPAAPSREGHTFTGWTGDYSNVKADTTITAQYAAEQYTVSFVNSEGIVLKTKLIDFGEAFPASEIPTVVAPTGYAFVGWVVKTGPGSSYEAANGNVTFEPSFSWKNADLPLAVSIVNAERNADSSGYTLKVRISNATDQALDAKLVSVVKTSYDKMLITNIKRGVSVPAFASEMEETISIACKDVGKIVEVYLVANDKENNDRTGGAYSETATASVTKSASSTYTYWGDWSDWQTAEVTSSETREVEQKTQYSYRDKETTTSTTSTLDGWTPIGSSTTYGNWGSWSSWDLTSRTKSDVMDVETRTVYYYFHYCDGNGNIAPSTGYTYGKYGPHTLYSTTKLKKDRTSSTGYDIADGEAKCVKNCGSYYYGGTKTQYRYRTRTKTVTYSFWRWSNWSAYEDTFVTSSENREVRSRVLYRFRDLLTGTESSSTGEIGTEPQPSGTAYTVSGNLTVIDGDYSGKAATVMVYKEKNVDPSEEQMEYVTQIVLGAGNSYNFTFTPKDEISLETGDYIVSFGIATADRLVNNVFRIEAPKPTYEVTFKNTDGTILETQTIEEGKDAVAPAFNVPEGYELRWNRTLTNITRSVEITAELLPKIYTVVFIDWANSEVVRIDTDVEYGTAIRLPANRFAEGKRFIGWSIPEGSIVTNTMVIEAVYEDITHKVRFLNRDGSVFSMVDSVSYGSSAEPPETQPVAEGYQFLAWDTATPWWNVKADVDVKPVFIFAETVEPPLLCFRFGNHS